MAHPTTGPGREIPINTLQGLPNELQRIIVRGAVVADNGLPLSMFTLLYDKAVSPFGACARLETTAAAEAMRENTWSLMADTVAGAWTNRRTPAGAPLPDWVEGIDNPPPPGPPATQALFFHDSSRTMDPRAHYIHHLRIQASVIITGADLNAPNPFIPRPQVLRLFQLLPIVFPHLKTLDVELETFPDLLSGNELYRFGAGMVVTAQGHPEARRFEIRARVGHYARLVSRSCRQLSLRTKTLTLIQDRASTLWGKERWDDSLGNVEGQGRWMDPPNVPNVVVHFQV